MKRRDFLFTAAAASVAALVPPAFAAPTRFASSRISVVVQGSGPDVVLIPGLTASRDMWQGTVAAMPGYRYHRSEEHTSELQSLMRISYAVFCLKKKKLTTDHI